MMRTWMAAAVMLLATSAWAQTTVTNPSKVEFDSTDHNVACPADSCIQAYRLEIWLPGVDPTTGSPASQATVAKSNVVATGTTPAYRIDKANWGVSYPPGTTVVMRIVAVGQGVESARSLPSGPFVRTAAPPAVPASVAVKP